MPAALGAAALLLAGDIAAAQAPRMAAGANRARTSTPGQALTRDHPAGIWKAAIPPRPMRGEFDDFDPIGVEAGARVKADCSLNWTNPDDGKLYCFSSGTSLEVFLEEPLRHLAEATAAWRRMAQAAR